MDTLWVNLVVLEGYFGLQEGDLEDEWGRKNLRQPLEASVDTCEESLLLLLLEIRFTSFNGFGGFCFFLLTDFANDVLDGAVAEGKSGFFNEEPWLIMKPVCFAFTSNQPEYEQMIVLS